MAECSVEWRAAPPLDAETDHCADEVAARLPKSHSLKTRFLLSETQNNNRKFEPGQPLVASKGNLYS